MNSSNGKSTHSINDPNTNYKHLFKAILVGDFGVGKSSILLRTTNNTFRESYSVTIGIDFGVKVIDVNNEFVKFQIWDTAGQERFRTIGSQYFKDKECYILVFDLSNYKSFENLKEWITDIKYNISDNRPSTFFLVGTKTDLVRNPFLTPEYINKFIKDNNIANYFEISNKTNDNNILIDMFRKIATVLIKKDNNNKPKPDKINNIGIDYDFNQSSKGCCVYL